MGALSFTRSMRWNGSTAFSRPVRWLLALHGSTVLPFSFAGLQAGGSDSTHHQSRTCHLQSITSVLHSMQSAALVNFQHAVVNAAHSSLKCQIAPQGCYGGQL